MRKVLARKTKPRFYVINRGDLLPTWKQRPLEMMTRAENQKLRKAQYQKRSPGRVS